MLKVKAFGTAPLPTWAEDESSVELWAKCRIGRPQNAPKLRPDSWLTEKDAELFKSLYKGWMERPDPTNLVAWEIKEESGFSFGWGGIRFSIKEDVSKRISLEIDGWGRRGWAACGKGFDKGLSVLLDVATGRGRLTATEDKVEPPLFWPNCAPYSVAPWSTDDLIHLGGAPVFCRSGKGALEVFEMQSNFPSVGMDDFRRWIGHRLRYAARRWPALRWIWAAARSHEKKSVFPVATAIQALNHEPQWMTHSVDWLIFCHTDLSCQPLLDWQAFRFREYAAHNIKAVPDIFEPEHLGDYLGVGYALPSVCRWSDSLPLAQALRLIKAAQQGARSNVAQRGQVMQKSHLFMVMHGLARARLPVPSEARLNHMMNMPHLLMAWLLEQKEWCSSTAAWPYPHYNMEYGDGPPIKCWRTMLSNLKKEYLNSPVAFRALARAGQAWMATPIKRKGLSVSESLAADEEVFSQLQSPALSAFLEWDRLGRKAPWVSYVRLLRSARARALDFHAQDEQPGVVLGNSTRQNEVDAPWPSALGLFSVGDIKVFPLCRPSHLNSVGEFFQNCVVASNRLDHYVRAARSNRQRFFRLESEDNLAFLALVQEGNKGAWVVDDVRGRFNKVTTEAMQVAADQVAQFYSLLVPVKSTPPEDDEDEADAGLDEEAE